MIQIIEFTAMLELYNFEYDPELGKLMNRLGDVTEFDVIPMPLNDWASRVENSIAAPWAGKLSEAGAKPYLLQEAGYPGLLLIVRKNIFYLSF